MYESFDPRFDELEALIVGKVNILVITENKLGETFPSNLVFLFIFFIYGWLELLHFVIIVSIYDDDGKQCFTLKVESNNVINSNLLNT